MGAGEMTCFRGPEFSSQLCSSAHAKWLRPACTSSPRGCNASGLCKHLHACAQTTPTHTFIIKNNPFLSGVIFHGALSARLCFGCINLRLSI